MISPDDNHSSPPHSPKGGAVLCRDCGHQNPLNVKRCAGCGSRRLLSHPELTSLSIAHVDCDAFFAAVEKRDNPSLLDRPVIVGGGRRGVVSTCCYIARTFGVRSAMPMFKARDLCPQAVVVKPRYEKYVEAARLIRTEMDMLTPLVQPLSIDEAFLDLTGTEKLHGNIPAAILAQLALTIEEKVGITISVGLSHNKFLAKSASDLDKPRGFAIIGQAEAKDFLAKQPTRFVFGVGASFSTKLERDGFRTLQDIQNADVKTLIRRYGEHGLRLYRLAHGEDDRPVKPERETKSISGETTFSDDMTGRDRLEDRLYAMAVKVAARAKVKELAGRVVTLKLKTAGFKSLTRRKTLAHHTNLLKVIFETGLELLREEVPGPRSTTAYRLIGIGISDLAPAAVMDADFLFPDEHKRLGAQENAVSALRARFGDDVIGTMRDKRTNKHPSPGDKGD
ncbi:MAG: DNA polymerase IV [Pseudomonadota bacterium]